MSDESREANAPKSGRYPWGDVSKDTLKRQRKTAKHLKRAKTIDTLTPILSTTISMCSEIGVTAATMSIVEGLGNPKGSIPMTIVNGIGTFGIGLAVGMVVDHGVEVCMNALYNNEVLLAAAGVDYMDLMRITAKPMEALSPEEHAVFAAMNAVDDDTLKETGW